MQSKISISSPHWQRKLSRVLGLYALIAGAVSFSGWPLDVPRLTDWFGDGVSTQPNTAVLVATSGAAVLLLQTGFKRTALVLGALVVVAAAANLLQYVVGADLGFNQLLLFGRRWGQGSTVSPGRFGLPASISLILIGLSIVLLSIPAAAARRFVPKMALAVALLMMFSLFGYLFGARNFFAIPWLSAIALPTSTMLMALALSLIVSVPEHQPMLLLSEDSSAGAMARTVLPILIVIIPSVSWFRGKGYQLELFDMGTGLALSSASLVLAVVVIMWIALLALRRREQREREADRRKDEFLAMLAHELRNPLAPIRNATSILKLAYNNRGAFDRAPDTIGRQWGKLARLTDALPDASRISRGKMDLRRERVELAPIIRQTVEACCLAADGPSRQVTLALPSQPTYLDADPVRLSQIVGNLLNNACKFSAGDRTIHLSVQRHDHDVEITVKDEGIGIPAEKLESIFEMFSQLDMSLERSRAGLGIGLTLAKRLAELHGGSIEARSEGLGRGSEFIVRLPLAVDQTPVPTQEPANAIQPGSKRRILVVDDNRDSAGSLATLLRLAGNETAIAHDGEEAVEAAAQGRPDVILLDIGLPKLNGYDACRRIRANAWGANVLIIALTGWGQDEDRRKSDEAGFDGHLVKPVDHDELMRLVASEATQPENPIPQSLG
ncbi:MAG TPA: ATP-binding protein [Lacipirellulaceae bacterium]|nr:ATP-binding protein [Lacipirellulaceae bacterium]